jgi:hypothetical protein
MKTKSDHDPDSNIHANDNDHDETSAVAPTPSGGALASLAALGTMLNKVDTASVVGRSGLPMLQFKSREGSGTWMFGQRRTVPENGSRWAINPLTFRWGYVCFKDATKPVGEHLVSVSQPKPNPAELPDTGFPWGEEWSVDLKCLDGADAGVEVTFKSTTNGGIKAVATLIDNIRGRLNSGQHDDKISPVVLLEKDSYPHQQYGRVWEPLFSIVDWMSMSGPAPAPKPESPPLPPPANTNTAAAQPRRRRVG